MKKGFCISLGFIFVFMGAVIVFASPKGSMMMEEENAGSMMDDSMMVKAKEAVASIQGTQPESTVSGTANLMDTEAGLKVQINLSGVPNPGEHAIHIHQEGSCAEGGNAAGGHYNPHNVTHGFLPKDGIAAAHVGDMGNILIDDQGNGSLEIILPNVTLMGENAVAGKAIILHEKMDDFGQPTGNAGGRIGCGTIAVYE